MTRAAIKVSLTRDSVSAGDDLHAPHAKKVRLEQASSVGDLLEQVTALRYLPTIVGGEATWVAVSHQPIAVHAQQWTALRLLSTFPIGIDSLVSVDGAIRLHFSYLAQLNPEQVFEVLQSCTFKAD